ncbi:hypothetical protein RRG08_057990 [Elysia crispata]|uniref:Uncharacterized protein n=1 Tax=Elysia crispata TaxID=231223 RepID=A0AAE1AF80_9GAST|nr:hypothetical protein RRG08_057990 [Elysia crispata]
MQIAQSVERSTNKLEDLGSIPVWVIEWWSGSLLTSQLYRKDYSGNSGACMNVAHALKWAKGKEGGLGALGGWLWRRMKDELDVLGDQAEKTAQLRARQGSGDFLISFLVSM